MPIYHLHAQIIGRGQGRSSVAASAYRAACKLIETIIDKETGISHDIVHDYTNKKGVVYSVILAPENAPAWCYDRELLWNKIQNEFEKRKDSQYCREIDLALPKELTEEQNTKLLTEFVNKSLVKEGMVADVNFHNDNPENPHAHIMLSTREIVEVEDGENTFGKKVTHWNSNEFLVHTRRMWAGFINKHLEQAGIDEEVSHLSHSERGIGLAPTIKEGIARFVEGSERSDINKKICAYNEELIRRNPELIIDKYFQNKVVFTKEDIAKELFNIFTATVPVDMEGTTANRDETNNNDNTSSPSSTTLLQGSNNELNQQKILSDYISALDRVMGGDKIALLQARDINGKQLYTTRNRLELEKSFLDIANSLKQGEQLHQINIADADLDKKSFSEEVSEKVKQALGFNDTKVKLSQQQRAVVLEVLRGGNVSVIEGLPGAGKTATMSEVVRQYKKWGYSVEGAAVSSSAARELTKSAGIDAVNITKLRHKLDHYAGRKFSLNLEIDYFKSEVNDNEKGRSKSKLTAKKALIVDEASMVDLTEMHYILREVQKAGTKLILVLDSNQLPSVGTQGAAEKIAEMFGVSRLNEVKRQKKISHRNATELLSKFKVTEAIELYRKDNAFIFSDAIEKAKDALAKDYVKEYILLNKSNDKENQLLSSKIAALAYRNKDIAYLNSAIRTKLVDEGIIRGKEYKFVVSREGGEREQISLAKGDQVVFTRNSKFLGVANSEVGEVIGFSTSRKGFRDTILIKIAEGEGSRVVEVDNFHFKGFDYGYAVNVYKAQGKTYESVKGLIDSYTGYNVFNVMATRHTSNIKLYASDDILQDELFKKISLDPKQAATEFEIKSSPQDSESARYAGLVAIVQKRGNTSFAGDYEDKGRSLSVEGKVIERYVEVRNEVIKVRQAIDHWIETEGAKGKVRSLFDTPYADDLKALLEERQDLAVSITENYGDFKKILTQANINYNTIEKHAGKGEYQYSFRRLDYAGLIKDIKGLSEILDIQEKVSKYEEGSLFEKEIKDSATKLSEISGRLHLEFEEHKLAIFKARTELHKATDDKYRAQTYIQDGRRYIDKSFNEYLENTYKASAEEILKQWQVIREEKGLEKALAIVKSTPQELGKLKGVGIGTFLALTDERRRANENSEVLQEKFRKYEEYNQTVPEKGKELARGEYDNQITEKEIAVKTLEARLPSKSVQDYIARAYKASMVDNSNTKGKEQKVILTWAKDNVVKAQSAKYRELLANKNLSLVRSLEHKERNRKEYIKEREALLKQYEYSKGNEDRSKLYRHIAGSTEPDLAYDILKNLCFIGMKEDKAIFIVASDNLSKGRLEQIQDKLLGKVQDSISYNTNSIELQTKEQNQFVKQQEKNKGSALFPQSERIGIKEHLWDDIVDTKDPKHLTFTAADELKLEIDSERITNIVIGERIKRHDNLQKEISYQEIMSAKAIYQQRETRIELLATQHEHVLELKKVDPLAGRYFAENLVDAQMTSSVKVLNNEVIEQQRVIAIAQANAIRSLPQIEAIHGNKVSNSNNKFLTKEVVREDHIQKSEYIKHELGKSLSQAMASSKSIKLDVDKVQAITNETIVKADQNMRSLQQQYSNNRQQELQQNQQRQLNLNRGIDR